MTTSALTSERRISLPFYYGWAIVAVGALAMVATLPGRTHGLGMITERLLNDPRLQLSRTAYGWMNLWATLLGALFCLPCGYLIDRLGSRIMLTGVVVGLAAVVLVMSNLTGQIAFFVALPLTRGLGQSALSVVSMTVVGKWFQRRLGLAMSVYSFLVAIGFIVAFRAGSSVRDYDWRGVWSGMGWILLLGIAPLSWLLTRDTPAGNASEFDGRRGDALTDADSVSDFPLAAALLTPAFWIFALSSSTYGLIASGISLFNESILIERGFDKSVFYEVSMISTGTALLSNLLGGWIATRWSMPRVMAVAMLVLAGALVSLPWVSSYLQAVCYGMAMGVAGGVVTVLFFMFWSKAYGRAHLGRIQGAAQMLTVVASALGPLLLAECKARTGSYTLMFYVLAGIVACLGAAAWQVTVPNPHAATEPEPQPALAT